VNDCFCLAQIVGTRRAKGSASQGAGARCGAENLTELERRPELVRSSPLTVVMLLLAVLLLCGIASNGTDGRAGCCTHQPPSPVAARPALTCNHSRVRAGDCKAQGPAA